MRVRGQARVVRATAWLHARLQPLRGPAQGYLLAPFGVAVATVAIGVVLHFTTLSNVSLIYLPVVLWLAATYGQGPAILASVLSFLSYDFFFIPPEHLFTVDRPAEWISLFALLATSLVLGHLTSIVRARAEEAQENQRRAETLYHLAQLIATTANEHELHEALAREVVRVFAPSGVYACALLLPDETGALQINAFWSEEDEHAYTVDSAAPDSTQRQIEQRASLTGATVSLGARPAIVRAPLKTARGVVGALLISGAPSISGLAPSSPPQHADMALTASETLAQRQAPLFATFRDQIALALDRATLARDATHTAALRESDKLKDALLGSVTHELRTPLATIKAAVSSLQETGTWATSERAELLTSIDVSADRLNHLVGNLLDLSRLEAGVARPEKDWRLMSDVIAATLDQFERSGQLRHHVIRIDEPDEAPLVYMDQEQIQQVLTNLIENALKYSPEGSEIHIQSYVQDAWLSVSVSDQGIGIPAAEMTAIFNKFYRVQHARLPWSKSRPPIGTGLGLAICGAIVREHGGRIWAESAPDHGATLTFTLPISSERPQGSLPEITATSADSLDTAQRPSPQEATP